MFEFRSVNLFLVIDVSWSLMKEGPIWSFSNTPVEKSHCDEDAAIHPQRGSGILLLEMRAQTAKLLSGTLLQSYE
jgi:hypothetical protein